MKFLFEDSPTSALTILFKAGFDSEVVKDMVFTSSCGEILKISRKYIDYTEEEVYAFIDVVPDNIATVSNFIALWEFSHAHLGRMRVIPVVCSEYYLLKGVENTKFVKDDKLLKFCLYGRCHLADTKWVESKSSRFTFEQYYKHTVKAALIRCLGDEDRKRRKFFMLQDCVCSNPISTEFCDSLSLTDKSAMYLSAYPLLPNGSVLLNKVKSTDEIYWNYIINFISNHNQRVQSYTDFTLDKAEDISNNYAKCFIRTNTKGVPLYVET